jgi:hypothetical protein
MTESIVPGKKYQVVRDIPGVASKGQIVRPGQGVIKTDDGVNCFSGPEVGKSGKILCSVDPVGSLFFDSKDLKEADNPN